MVTYVWESVVNDSKKDIVITERANVFYHVRAEMSQVFETFRGLSLSHLQKLPKPVFPITKNTHA